MVISWLSAWASFAESAERRCVPASETGPEGGMLRLLDLYVLGASVQGKPHVLLKIPTEASPFLLRPTWRGRAGEESGVA